MYIFDDLSTLKSSEILIYVLLLLLLERCSEVHYYDSLVEGMCK